MATSQMAGGTVCVCGPTNGGNGALDYNGTATVTGGTLIACGAVGMKKASVTPPHIQCSARSWLDSFSKRKTDYH